MNQHAVQKALVSGTLTTFIHEACILQYHNDMHGSGKLRLWSDPTSLTCLISSRCSLLARHYDSLMPDHIAGAHSH